MGRPQVATVEPPIKAPPSVTERLQCRFTLYKGRNALFGGSTVFIISTEPNCRNTHTRRVLCQNYLCGQQGRNAYLVVPLYF